QRSNLGLAEVHFVERAPHAEFTRRLPTWPIIAAIVGVVAVDDDGIAVRGDAREMGVQLVLAVVAAVGRTGAILGSLELVGVDDLVAQPKLPGDVYGELAVALRIARAVGCNRKSTIAEHAAGDIGEVGAVDAAAESHHDGAERGQRAAKGLLFLD